MFIYSALTLILTLAPDCSFRSAFQKAMSDAETNSYGANLDQFCFGASDEERTQFEETYDSIRAEAPKLKELNVTAIPFDSAELNHAIEAAEIRNQVEGVKNATAANTAAIQNQTAVIESLRDNLNLVTANNPDVFAKTTSGPNGSRMPSPVYATPKPFGTPNR